MSPAGGRATVRSLTSLLPRPVLLVAAGAFVAALALLAWQLSPRSYLLSHDRGGDVDGAALVGWFTAGWLLMAAATMLPASLPLLSAFGRLLGGRPDMGRLVATVVAAYLAVWTGAGLMLASIDLGVHLTAERTALAAHTWVILPLTLLLAGGYQLSGLSAQCLRACRSPFTFLATGWSGRRAPGREATLIGIRYGLSCLGCCAALMLVMFAVGMSSPLVMIGLGALAAVHKYARWGAQLAKATGVSLVLAAVAIGLVQAAVNGMH